VSKKTKSQIFAIFSHATDIPEIYGVYVQLQSPYSFKISWDSVYKSGIYKRKTARRSFLPKIRGLLAQKLGVGSQNNCLRRKWYRDPHAKFCGDRFTHGDTIPKKESFLFLFFVLFWCVTLIWVSQTCVMFGTLTKYSFAICTSISTGFGAFLVAETYFKLPASFWTKLSGGATIFAEICKNVKFFSSKCRREVCENDFDHL